VLDLSPVAKIVSVTAELHLIIKVKLMIKGDDSYMIISFMHPAPPNVKESFPHLLTEFCTKLSTENVNKIDFFHCFCS